MDQNQKKTVEYYNGLRNTEYDLGGFTMNIGDDLSVTIAAKSGIFECKYSPGTLTWAFIVGYVGDGKVNVVTTFVKVLLFPTSMRIHDIDDKYITDIIDAHDNLSARNSTNGVNEAIEDIMEPKEKML